MAVHHFVICIRHDWQGIFFLTLLKAIEVAHQPVYIILRLQFISVCMRKVLFGADYFWKRFSSVTIHTYGDSSLHRMTDIPDSCRLLTLLLNIVEEVFKGNGLFFCRLHVFFPNGYHSVSSVVIV